MRGQAHGRFATEEVRGSFSAERVACGDLETAKLTALGDKIDLKLDPSTSTDFVDLRVRGAGCQC